MERTKFFLPSHEDGPDDQTLFEQKLASLAAVIDQEQPHVLALQEIGSDGAIGYLQAALTHQMPHSIEGQPDDRGIRVALVLCGDLNDGPEAATTMIIQGPSGSEIGTGGFPREDQGDGFRMWKFSSYTSRC